MKYNKYELQIAELVLMMIIAIATLTTQPPLPLLAIPFLLIMTVRSLIAILEEIE